MQDSWASAHPHAANQIHSPAPHMVPEPCQGRFLGAEPGVSPEHCQERGKRRAEVETLLGAKGVVAGDTRDPKFYRTWQGARNPASQPPVWPGDPGGAWELQTAQLVQASVPACRRVSGGPQNPMRVPASLTRQLSLARSDFVVFFFFISRFLAEFPVPFAQWIVLNERHCGQSQGQGGAGGSW